MHKHEIGAPDFVQWCKTRIAGRAGIRKPVEKALNIAHRDTVTY